MADESAHTYTISNNIQLFFAELLRGELLGRTLGRCKLLGELLAWGGPELRWGWSKAIEALRDLLGVEGRGSLGPGRSWEWVLAS